MLRALAILVCLHGAALADRVIVLDAGHGGSDPGGVGTGKQEKSIVLDVTERFKALLDADTADTAGGGAWTAKLTRTDDTFVSLAARSAYSNNVGADRFMSIHANAFSDPAAHGTETFAYAEGGNGAALRDLVQEEMLGAWGLTNRGNKTANFAVLRETAAPAELHELAFITNTTDAAKLGSPDERQKAAIAHLRAIQRHFNITPYVPGEATAGGEIGGHVVDDAGPIAGATLALDGGGTMTTDADGAFAFTGVPVGARTVTASAPGHDGKTVMVTVAAGVRADTDIELARTGDGGGEPDEPDPVDAGGCATGSGAGGLALVGLALYFARRRR